MSVSKILISLGSFVAGAAAGTIVTKIIMDKRCEDMINQEIESYKAHCEKRIIQPKPSIDDVMLAKEQGIDISNILTKHERIKDDIEYEGQEEPTSYKSHKHTVHDESQYVRYSKPDISPEEDEKQTKELLRQPPKDKNYPRELDVGDSKQDIKDLTENEEEEEVLEATDDDEEAIYEDIPEEDMRVVTKQQQEDEEKELETLKRQRYIEEANGVPKKPYLISSTEFSSEKRNYDKLTYNYYLKDSQLVDEQDNPKDDYSDLVPDFFNHFGEISGFKDIVYVRNDDLAIDYEIALVDDSYQQSVQHISPNTNYDNYDYQEDYPEDNEPIRQKIRRRKDRYDNG